MTKLLKVPNTDAKGRVTAWSRTQGGLVYAPSATSGGSPRLMLSPQAEPFAHPALVAHNTGQLYIYQPAPLREKGKKLEWKSTAEFGSYPESGTVTQSENEGLTYRGTYRYDLPSAAQQTFGTAVYPVQYPLFQEPTVPIRFDGLEVVNDNAIIDDTVAPFRQNPFAPGFGATFEMSATIAPQEGYGYIDGVYQHILAHRASACAFDASCALLATPNLTPGKRLSIWCELTVTNTDEGAILAMTGSTPPTQQPSFGAAAVPLKIKAAPIPADIADFAPVDIAAGEEVSHGFAAEIPLGANATKTAQWIEVKIPESRLLALYVELPIFSGADASGIINAINLSAGATTIQPGHLLQWRRTVSAIISGVQGNGVLVEG